ncbi:hypothetical protein BG015_001902 [Linnemannia schmuckeri]|uniref:Galactose oxidase n=1 Tax=Linnemannia schmuckeri TaxID=64567 RepID=A0A9P5S702_9FUNG|nr:hypothetical protein BG015_001902 [Linnemannia schmuckeri]
MSTCCMAYGTINESTLYVLGGVHYTGINEVNYTTQFYALDLTQTGWNTSNPPWRMMTYPSSLLPRATSSFAYSMAISPDNSTLNVWGVQDVDILAKYSVGGQHWTLGEFNGSVSGEGVLAVTDPTTGLVYFPGGGSNSSEIMVYNPDHLRSYPAPSVQELYADHGNKMILFGGDNGTMSTSSLYILDVPSMTWSQGTSAYEGRSGMACSVSGNKFIVWGGFKAQSSTGRVGVSAEPLIYNLDTDQWTTTY